MYVRLGSGQFLYRTSESVSVMPEVALLFDSHSGKVLAHGHARRVRARYERLSAIAQRAGHPELAECMVYWEGQFDPDDLNRALYSPSFMKHWYHCCRLTAAAATAQLLQRISAASKGATEAKRAP